MLHQPGHAQFIVLTPLNAGLHGMHHAQEVAITTRAADSQTRLTQYPLQQFAAAPVTQGLQQRAQFNGTDTEK
ncbi:hypothetical protein D3C85_1652870 [compost metagenome]